MKRAIIAGVVRGKVDAIVGTSVLDEGINIPNLSALHLTCPGNNRGKLLQQAGRIRRPQGKTPPVIRDYVDYRCKAVMRAHRNRRKWYKEMGWSVEDVGLLD